MITNTEPLSMAESLEYMEGEKDRGEEVRKFVKKFVKIKSEKAKELRKKLDAIKGKLSYFNRVTENIKNNGI